MSGNLTDAFLLYAEMRRGLVEYQVDNSKGACLGRVPVVLRLEGEFIASNLVGSDRVVREACLKWLSRNVNGVQMYERITGRAYTHEEKVCLAGEIGLVRDSPCPFMRSESCILPARPISCLIVPVELKAWLANLEVLAKNASPYSINEYGSLPAIIAARLDKPQLAALVEGRKVPDAALALSLTP